MRVFLRLLFLDVKRLLRFMVGKGPGYTWKKFHYEVRVDGSKLLSELGEFRDPVLVSGCQRSGTTILARVIRESSGMVNHWVGHDDELDGALILSGHAGHASQGRFCFQTTYLNESYKEYVEHKDNYKLIWVLRNPFSVVCSMQYNWGRFSFNELFDACGITQLGDDKRERYLRFGKCAIPRIDRACLSYNGKEIQALELMAVLGKERMMVIDYDELVTNKEVVLPKVYDFVGLPYNPLYAEKIHKDSVKKASQLSVREKVAIESLCMPVYNRVKEIAVTF